MMLSCCPHTFSHLKRGAQSKCTFAAVGGWGIGAVWSRPLFWVLWWVAQVCTRCS